MIILHTNETRTQTVWNLLEENLLLVSESVSVFHFGEFWALPAHLYRNAGHENSTEP